MYNTIIIGGGAAGLFCAANLRGENNLLLEGSKKLGQKILITGGGMCNITNMDSTDDFLVRFGSRAKSNFLKPALLNLSTAHTREWLESIGLELTIREDGKVFPKSLKASTLIDTLYRESQKNGIRIKYNSKVTGIRRTAEGFRIETCRDNYTCSNLVVATGGKSFPDTGSDGSGYSLIQTLTHSIIPPTPALCGVKIKNYPFKALSGNTVRSSYMDFFRDGESKRYFTTSDDVLFTHQGISGPGILNNARLIHTNDEIKISLLPCENREEKRLELVNKLNNSGKGSLKRVLKEIGLTTSMTALLGERLKLNMETSANTVNKKIKKLLINNLLYFPLTVSDKMGFNTAMATAGGVDITEINRKTMESKKIPGLYFAGEIIDIDGDTGGYNIQAAFSTAKLVSDAINKL